MAGHDIIQVKFLRPLIQLIKFQKAVAVDAWIRRHPFFISLHKSPDHTLLKPVREIKYIKRDVQMKRNASGIFNIIQRTAGMLTAHTHFFILKKLHGDARAVITCLLHKICSDGGIHSAAHRY